MSSLDSRSGRRVYMLMELHDQLAVGSPLIALLLIQPKNVQPCGICRESRL